MFRDGVSVLVASYNGLPYLTDAVESALKSIDTAQLSGEVIIVDDGSVDRTMASVAELFGGDERVRLFRVENSGQAAAQTVGMSKVRFRYVCLLDSDDLFDARKVARVVEVFRDGNVDWVFHRLRTFGLAEAPIGPTALMPTRSRARSKLALGLLPFLPTATSGLCFTAAFALEHLVPIPSYIGQNDLYAKVVALRNLSKGAMINDELGSLRLHGKNTYSGLEGPHRSMRRSADMANVARAIYRQDRWVNLLSMRLQASSDVMVNRESRVSLSHVAKRSDRLAYRVARLALNLLGDRATGSS